MPFAFARFASLTSFVALSALSTLVHAQAPGDASTQTCLQDTPPNGVLMLLDSGWYSTLLAGSNPAGWTQTPSGKVRE